MVLHPIELGEHRRRPAQQLAVLRQRFVGGQRGHQPGALLGHRARAVLVEQVAVLDRAHAGTHRAGDRARRIGVRHRVGVRRFGFLANRAHLLERELRAVDRVGGARHAASGHDLDLVGAAAQLLSRGLAHLAHAVGDRAQEPDAGAGAHQLVGGHRPDVAVPAGLRDRLAGDEQARPAKQPALHRLHEPVVGAGGVAHRGETAHQHAEHDVLGLGRDQRRRRDVHLEQFRLGGGHVHVRVDQAGQQRAPGQVEHLRVIDAGGVEQEVGDLPALDHHGGVRSHLAAGRVEHVGSGEGKAWHAGAPWVWGAPTVGSGSRE